LAVLILLAGLPGGPAGAPAALASEPSAVPEGTDLAQAGTGSGGADQARSLEAQTLTIGFTASQTGKFNVESIRQVNGLKLWIDRTNAAGGLVVGQNRYTFRFVSYDDESSKERVQELYTRLATEDEADFLIGPYSSGLTDAAALIAEQYGKIMITTGAASDATYKRGYTLVYQTYTPASGYLVGAIDLLAHVDSTAKRVAFLYENDKFSADVMAAAREYAKQRGYDIVLDDGYATGTADFSPMINKLEAATPRALLGGGHFQDGTTLARQLYEKKIDLGLLVLMVAPPEPTFAELGDAARGVIGPSQWEAAAGYNPEAAKKMGIEWFGPDGADLARAYEAAYHEEFSYHVAGGYAAGLILEKALTVAGSNKLKAVKTALDQMDVLTFFGRLKFDSSPESHGLQIGHEMLYIQWQPDAEGNLVRQMVWPRAAATAEVLYPMR